MTSSHEYFMGRFYQCKLILSSIQFTLHLLVFKIRTEIKVNLTVGRNGPILGIYNWYAFIIDKYRLFGE